MIDPPSLRETLRNEAQDLRDQRSAHEKPIDKVLQWLYAAQRMPYQELMDRLPKKDASVLPTEDHLPKFSSPLRHDKKISDIPSRAEGHRWAVNRLSSYSSVAIDGSQITPSSHDSYNIGIVYALALFQGAYQHGRCALFEQPLIIAPAYGDVAEDVTEDIVRSKRTLLEIRTATAAMKRMRENNVRQGICLLDGPIAPLFARKNTTVSPELAASIESAITDMLEVSQQCAIPVLGYIARPRSQSVVKMLQRLNKDTSDITITDGEMYAAATKRDIEPQKAWGARSSVWISDRPGIVEVYKEGRIACWYLVFDRQCARIEMPAWVQKQAMINDIWQWLLAQCMLGLSYPLIATQVDAKVASTAHDRRMWEQWLQQEGLINETSAKQYGKQHAR